MSYQTLITADQLLDLHRDGNVTIVDCRFSLADPEAGQAEYVAGHLPSAVYAHLNEHLSSPVTAYSGRHPLPNAETFAAQLAAWGIDRSMQVVAYDDSRGAFASRFWWLARWVGLSDVAVLDGGLAGWVNGGRPMVTQAPVPTPTNFAPTVDDSMWITSETLIDKLRASELLLIDARAAERFRGEVEPIDSVAGHVPGAINLPFTGNFAATGEFLPADALRQRFAGVVGSTGDRTVVHMCGSGVTACMNLLAMEHAGLPKSMLYSGSWSEYLRDGSRPVAAGSS